MSAAGGRPNGKPPLFALPTLALVIVGVIADAIGQHSWADVAYVGALAVLAIVNAYAHKKIRAKAIKVEREVVDVKRATGLTKRDEDPNPVSPFESAQADVSDPCHRRWVDRG